MIWAWLTILLGGILFVWEAIAIRTVGFERNPGRVVSPLPFVVPGLFVLLGALMIVFNNLDRRVEAFVVIEPLTLEELDDIKAKAE